MNIEVGKTYLARNGLKVTIEAELSGVPKTYVMQGIDERGRVTWRSRKGRFVDKPHPCDLVREAD